MAVTKDENRPPARECDADTLIREHVLRALGRPTDVHRVIVRRLWPGSYRVNVLVGHDAATTTIAHSYFLLADDEGTVTGCMPPIIRQRAPAAG
jgi:hypothetical protein